MEYGQMIAYIYLVYRHIDSVNKINKLKNKYYKINKM